MKFSYKKEKDAKNKQEIGLDGKDTYERKVYRIIRERMVKIFIVAKTISLRKENSKDNKFYRVRFYLAGSFKTEFQSHKST